MVIDLGWYARLFERGEGIKVSFSPYDISPQPQSGGAIVLAGKFTAPDGGARLTEVYWDLVIGAPNAQKMMPVPGGWWTNGRWDQLPEAPVNDDPIPLRLNLDAYVMDSYDSTLALTLMSWDGSPAITRSSESGGISSSVLGMLTSAASTSGVPFAQGPSGGLLSSPYAGAIFPQLQGVMSDMLKEIASGLGITISYSPASAGYAGYASAGKPLVRLINPTHSARTIVRPTFTPAVDVTNYNMQRVTNKVIYGSKEAIQVNSGEDQDITATLEATPIWASVIQPVSVPGIPVIPYLGPSSIYCVYDSDGYEAHNVWDALGGKITVGPGAEPNEMLIHIKAPFDASNPTATYTVAEDQNPAFYISAGDAAVFHKEVSTYFTGAVLPASQYRPSDYQNPALDNKLVVNTAIATSRAVALMIQEAKPILSMDTVEFENGVLRDQVTGAESSVDPAILSAAKFRAHGAMWRFSKLDYDKMTGFTGSAVECTTVGDFDLEYAAYNVTGGLQAFQDRLAALYPDGSSPTFGTAQGKFPVGTAISGSLIKPAPSIEQFEYEPLIGGFAT